MGKIIKKLFRVLIVIMVLAGLLMLAATMFAPTDKIRTTVVDYVAESTGAEVTLGDASLTFFPSLGVRLSDGHIRGSGQKLAEASGAANNLGNFEIALDHLDVRLSVLPLLKKTIEIGAISFVGSILRLELDKGALIVEDYALEVSSLSLLLDQLGAGNAVAVAGKGEAVPPGKQIPAGLAFGLEFHAADITYQKNLFQNVVVSGKMAEKVLAVGSISAQKGGGAITGGLVADWADDPWGKLNFKLTVAKVPAGALFSPWVVGMEQRLDCILDGAMAGECALRDSETILGTLDVVGSLHSGEGILYASDLLHDVGPYLGKRQDLKDIHFHALAHNFMVQQGRYLVQDLEIDGLDTDWTCKGWVSFQGTLDLGIRVKLPPGFTPDLGSWSFLAESLRDSEGRVPLAFKLQGKTSRPKVIMDFSGFSQMQKDAKVSAREAVESASKKGLSEILDKWKTR